MNYQLENPVWFALIPWAVVALGAGAAAYYVYKVGSEGLPEVGRLIPAIAAGAIIVGGLWMVSDA